MARIRIELDGIAAATKTDLRNIQRTTWRFVGLFWHRTYKAIHFTKRAMRRYGYTPRRGDPGSGRRFKGSYQELKLLRKPLFKGSNAGTPIGEVKPLVWSGRSRALAMASRKVEATAKSSGRGRVDIIINAPALNFSGPKGRINMRREMETVTAQEELQMGKVASERFIKELNRLNRRRTAKG